jgi:hypothetical protein
VHVLIIASVKPLTDSAISFAWPRDGAALETERLLNPKRTRAVSLGWVRWAGHDGQLVLAPQVNFGGMVGDHLIFRIVAGNVTYDISIHSWAPLAQAVATLRRLVESTALGG